MAAKSELPSYDVIYPIGFLDYIKTNCLRSECGALICKKCKNTVIIDWFDFSLECQGCDEL